jgi:hypothetical protein
MTFEKLFAISGEVSKVCKQGSKSTQIRNGIFVPTWDKILKILQGNSAVMCQGNAYALMLKYHSMGLESFHVGLETFIDGRITDRMTHVITLVKHNNKLIPLDPTFNAAFKVGNRPATYDELMDGKARVIERPLQKVYIHYKGDEREEHPYRTKTLIDENDNYQYYRSDVSISKFEQFFNCNYMDIYKGSVMYRRGAVL